MKAFQFSVLNLFVWTCLFFVLVIIEQYEISLVLEVDFESVRRNLPFKQWLFLVARTLVDSFVLTTFLVLIKHLATSAWFRNSHWHPGYFFSIGYGLLIALRIFYVLNSPSAELPSIALMFEICLLMTFGIGLMLAWRSPWRWCFLAEICAVGAEAFIDWRLAVVLDVLSIMALISAVAVDYCKGILRDRYHYQGVLVRFLGNFRKLVSLFFAILNTMPP